MKIYILRLNQDQLRKMQFQGLWLGIEPALSGFNSQQEALELELHFSQLVPGEF